MHNHIFLFLKDLEESLKVFIKDNLNWAGIYILYWLVDF